MKKLILLGFSILLCGCSQLDYEQGRIDAIENTIRPQLVNNKSYIEGYKEGVILKKQADRKKQELENIELESE